MEFKKVLYMNLIITSINAIHKGWAMQAKGSVGLTVGTHVLGVVRNLGHVARPVFLHVLALVAVHVRGLLWVVIRKPRSFSQVLAVEREMGAWSPQRGSPGRTAVAGQRRPR